MVVCAPDGYFTGMLHLAVYIELAAHFAQIRCRRHGRRNFLAGIAIEYFLQIDGHAPAVARPGWHLPRQCRWECRPPSP